MCCGVGANGFAFGNGFGAGAIGARLGIFGFVFFGNALDLLSAVDLYIGFVLID